MRLSVAIPGSSLSDEPLKSGKARKASVLARACAVFGVETIFVYRDAGAEKDGAMLAMMLRYLETPQFLRRRLFPRVNDLKFAGVMQPLGIPSHSVTSDARQVGRGDVREGIVVSARGERFVDTGMRRLVPYRGRARPGSRVTVQFKEGHPGLSAKEIPRSEAPGYWGYVVRERASLYSVLAEWEGRIILTSRKGRPAAPADTAGAPDPGLLLAFGSPERGIPEMLGSRSRRLQNARTLNFFPGQHTRTVRLEEALLGTLAIINSRAAP